MSYRNEKQMHEATQTNKLIAMFSILFVMFTGALLIHDLEIRKLDHIMECRK